MIEETLRRLLEDPNVPRDLAARAVAAGLEAWQTGTLPASASEFVQRFTMDHAEYRLKGPSAGFPGSAIRVTRIMSEETFARSYVQQGLGASIASGRKRLQHLLEHPEAQKHLRPQDLLGRYGITWVTLEDEIASPSPDGLADSLGLSFFSPQRLVGINYTIAPSALRVPTVFDAFGSPYFATTSAAGQPRSWNWKTNRPGLVEVIHSSSAKVANLSLSSLGEITRSTASSPFQQITLPNSQRVTEAIKHAIRTTEARTEITAFLDEKSDFLHLNDREFELFLGALYKLRGYDAKVTQATRDGGFDVIAVRETETREQILLQAKKTEGTVGVSVIRELAGARYFAGAKHLGSILVVATTGRFSQPARQLENQHAAELRLHDYLALKDMVSTARGVTLADIAQDAVKLSRLS